MLSGGIMQQFPSRFRRRETQQEMFECDGGYRE